jgi:hypothetical protein
MTMTRRQAPHPFSPHRSIRLPLFPPEITCSYGTGRLEGQSERLLGKFIREHDYSKGVIRGADDVFVATKVRKGRRKKRRRRAIDLGIRLIYLIGRLIVVTSGRS